MANVLVNETSLQNIANSIRKKNETQNTYKPAEMDEAIDKLTVVNTKDWVRPSDWPDYSQVDLTNQEVIYLTYDTKNIEDPYISIRVYGDYTIARGSLTAGVFTAVNSVDCASGTIFQENLPLNEGDYLVYKITPQTGAQLTRFNFAKKDDPYSTNYFRGWAQPCIERYCRLPNWIGVANRGADQWVWTTQYLVADTVMDATPTGSMANAYNDKAYILYQIDLSTCSFKNVTSLNATFSNLNSLNVLKIPKDISSNCTNLNGTFYCCYRLKTLDLKGWDTSNVTTMTQAFRQCQALVEIIGIEDFDVSKCTTFSYMFNNCYNLKKLDLSKWETTSDLTSIELMFSSCWEIRELDCSGFNTSNVSSFSEVFGGCNNLESLDISTWTISNKATNLSWMFGNDRKLKNLNRAKNWNTSNVKNFSNMFKDCRSLKSIDISDFDFSKAETIRYMFQGCGNLQYLKASLNLTAITARANVGNFIENAWKFKDLSNITFSNCKFMPGFGYDYAIEKIVIPSTVTQLGESCLRDLQHCKVLDFTNLSVVPSISGAGDITNGYNTNLKIFVPTSLYSSWIGTTNWNNEVIALRTFPATDYSLYNGTASGIISMDLSGVTWVRNYSYSATAAVGTAYSSMFNQGTVANAKRTASDLIDFPSNTSAILISVDPNYFCSALYFNNSGYLKKYIEWTNTIIIRPSSAAQTTKFALCLRYKDGSTALTPDNWANSGLTIKYIPNS